MTLVTVLTLKTYRYWKRHKIGQSMIPVLLHFPIPIPSVYSRKCFKLKQFSPLPPKIALYEMHASNDTGHHDAGYSYDTGSGRN